MGIRHDAREWALQFLFQSEFNQEDTLEESFRGFWERQDADFAAEREHLLKRGLAVPPSPHDLRQEERTRAKTRRFAEDIARGVIAHHEDIDRKIGEHAENWEVARMGVVDRNILRIAVYEMLWREDVPPVVSINEAVELAKAYSSRESGRFVNGILDNIRKELPRGAREATGPAARGGGGQESGVRSEE